MITIDTPGGTITADLHPGSPGAPTLLLLHGWCADAALWDDLVPLLARYTLIIPDLPGAGRSQPVITPRTLFDHALALDRLLDALDVASVTVVGHSMGGAAALLLAARNPARVARLLLVSISLFREERERRAFRVLLRAASQVLRVRAEWMAGSKMLVRLFVGGFVARTLPHTQEQRVFASYLHVDRGSAVASATTATSPAIVDAARMVRCPTLLLTMELDEITYRPNIAWTAAQIPGCQTQVMPACGHLPMVEQPAALAEIIAEWVL